MTHSGKLRFAIIVFGIVLGQLASAAQAQTSLDTQKQQRELELAAQGYLQISVAGFLLDGKNLARRERKVALQGIYVREDNLDVLYASREALIVSQRNNNQLRVPLLTNNASRSVRQVMLGCQSSGKAFPPNGCDLAVKGRATMCTARNAFGVTYQEPCIAVEDSW